MAQLIECQGRHQATAVRLSFKFLLLRLVEYRASGSADSAVRISQLALPSPSKAPSYQRDYACV